MLASHCRMGRRGQASGMSHILGCPENARGIVRYPMGSGVEKEMHKGKRRSSCSSVLTINLCFLKPPGKGVIGYRKSWNVPDKC